MKVLLELELDIPDHRVEGKTQEEVQTLVQNKVGNVLFMMRNKHAGPPLYPIQSYRLSLKEEK